MECFPMKSASFSQLFANTMTGLIGILDCVMSTSPSCLHFDMVIAKMTPCRTISAHVNPEEESRVKENSSIKSKLSDSRLQQGIIMCSVALLEGFALETLG
jgi:hypothetical protein